MKQINYPIAKRKSNTGVLVMMTHKYDPLYVQALDEYRNEYASANEAAGRTAPSMAVVQMEHTLRGLPSVRRRYEQLIKQSKRGRKYVYRETQEEGDLK